MRRLILAALCTIAACKGSSPAPAPAPDPTGLRASPTAPPSASPPLAVHVDPRIELLCIVMRLADADEFRAGPATPYAQAVDAHFARWKDHPAVAATRRLRAEHGISYDAPMQLAIHLDATFTPKVPLAPRPAGLDERWQGVDIAAYAAQLRDFAAATGFAEFMASQASYTHDVEARDIAGLASQHVTEWFAHAWGTRPGVTHLVVPGLLTGPMNFGSHVTLADGSQQMVQIVALEHPDAQGLPQPTTDTLDLLVHETSHSYVNPIFATATEVATVGPQVFALASVQLSAQAYKTWLTMVDESVVRATTVLFIRDQRGQVDADKAVLDERYRGFDWMPELVAALDAVRVRHGGRFDDHEVIIATRDVLVAWLAKHPDGAPHLPFRGSIDQAFAARGHEVVIAPTRTTALWTYVGKVAAKIGAAGVLDAAVVAHQALPHAAFMIYGSPGTNAVTAKLLTAFAWTVAPSGVTVAGKHFAGEHLVLIAAHAHPDDPSLGVVVYAAASDDDLVGVNNLFHGPTGYVVGRRKPDGSFATLEAGNL